MKKRLIAGAALCVYLCSGCTGRQTDTAVNPPIQGEARVRERDTTVTPGTRNANIPESEMSDLETTAGVPVEFTPAAAHAEPTVAYVFETNLGHSSKNRLKNMRMAAQKLSGAVIEPEEEFSFNRRVGARTVKAGYYVAPIIVQGKKEKGVGGGVCQVSTTLYNAALKAGFEITERHEHSKDVGYVEDGQDASVNYGHADLKIVNTGDRAVVITCEVLRKVVRVTLTELE